MSTRGQTAYRSQDVLPPHGQTQAHRHDKPIRDFTPRRLHLPEPPAKETKHQHARWSKIANAVSSWLGCAHRRRSEQSSHEHGDICVSPAKLCRLYCVCVCVEDLGVRFWHWAVACCCSHCGYGCTIFPLVGDLRLVEMTGLEVYVEQVSLTPYVVIL